MEILSIILIVLLIYVVFKVAYVALKILDPINYLLIVEFGSKLLGDRVYCAFRVSKVVVKSISCVEPLI